MQVNYDDVKEDYIRLNARIVELENALKEISEYHIESHEDAREMRDIAKAAINLTTDKAEDK